MQTSASIRSIPGELGDEEKGDPLAQGKDQATEAHLQAVTKAHNAQMQTLRDSHSRALQEVQTELETQHLSTLSEATREAEQAALAKHTVELQRLQQEHAEAASQMAEQLTALKTDHESVLEKLKADHASKLDRVLLDLQIVNSDRDETRRAYEELHASHQDMLAKIDIDPHEVDTLRAELNDTSDALVTLEAALTEAQEERDSLLIEIETIRQEAEAQQQDASLASSGSAVRDAAAPVPADAALKRELESHKSMLSKTRGDMTKLKVELQARRAMSALATSSRSRICSCVLPLPRRGRCARTAATVSDSTARASTMRRDRLPLAPRSPAEHVRLWVTEGRRITSPIRRSSCETTVRAWDRSSLPRRRRRPT